MPFDVNRNERDPAVNERNLRDQLPLAEHQDMPTLFSNDLAELILALLLEDQTKRAGSQRNGSARVKAYSFFSDINFDRIHNMVGRGSNAPEEPTHQTTARHTIPPHNNVTRHPPRCHPFRRWSPPASAHMLVVSTKRWM